MNSFEFFSPTKVYFGKGMREKAGECVKLTGAKKVLVHYGSERIEKSGLLGQVKKSLDEAGIAYELLGGVVPNPRVSLVRKGAELVRRENIDFILAVGGGSVIDSSKGIAMAAVNDCDIWDIYTGETKPAKSLPTGNILTIAAAGSETSNSTVLTNEDGWIKIGYNNNLVRPVFTIMDPELLYTLPPYQTACGLVDIIMHTLDRYFSHGGYNEVTDRIAEQILKVTMEYGKRCMDDPEDYLARSEVMWAGSLSHNDLTGLGLPGDWAVHMLEHELSGKFDVAHGAGLSAVWPAWARYVYKENPMRFARYGANVFGLQLDYIEPANTAVEAIKRTEEYFKSIGMPVTLTELVGKPVTDADIEDMAEKCVARGNVGSFVVIDRAKAADIYKAAL